MVDLSEPQRRGGATPRCEIRLAASRGHRDAATSLLRRRYQWRGYATGFVRAEAHGATLVACEGDRVVATVTVGFDSPKGMSVQSLYPNEIAALRAEGARLCEFTRLAVERTAGSLEVLATLFQAAYLYARRAHRATHLLAEVNPRHAPFYQRALGFTQAGPLRTCPRVDAPAVLISLALDHAERQIALHGGRPAAARPRHSLYPYFASPREEDRIAQRLLGLVPTIVG